MLYTVKTLIRYHLGELSMRAFVLALAALALCSSLICYLSLAGSEVGSGAAFGVSLALLLVTVGLSGVLLLEFVVRSGREQLLRDEVEALRLDVADLKSVAASKGSQVGLAKPSALTTS